MKISVLTPTYNRAHTLGRLFDSLLAQRFTNFEWVIVDDGSVDGTGDLLESFVRRSAFPIRIVHQPNQGRHIALNRAIETAAGEFSLFMDSDDWVAPDGLAALEECWESIPPDERDGFAGVAGLCADENGDLIGDPYPSESFDSDFLEIRAVYGIRGDKKEMVRSELFKRDLFPVFPGERRVPTSWLLNRSSEGRKVRFFNRIVVHKEYQPGGMSHSIDRLRARSPLGSRIFYQEVLLASRPLPFSYLLRSHINFIRYSLHARIPIRVQLVEIPGTTRWLAALPVGIILFLKDRLDLLRGGPRTG